VVTGHTHLPAAEERDGVLHLNPGSAGPRRFDYPVTVARLEVDRSRIAEWLHVELEPG
jgi:predicted phosphodiesterase